LVDFCFKILEKATREGNSKCQSEEEYFSLFEPAVDWVFQCLGHGSNKKLFATVYEMYETSKHKHPIILQSIIRYFPCDIIASATTTMLLCIKDNHPKDRDTLILLKELGLTLLKSPPKKNQPKLDYLNFGWESMKKTNNAHIFLDCAIVLVEFSIKNLNATSVNVFIKEIFKKL